MSKRFSQATAWIVQRRWLSALAIAIISAISVGGYVAPDSVVEWFKTLVERRVEKNEDRFQQLQNVLKEGDYQPPPSVETIPISGYDAIMVVESDAFFTPQGAEAIRSVVRRLESQAYVASVLWMDRIPVLNIFGLNEPLLPRKEAALERFEISRQRAREHPLVNGQLLSADGQTLLLLINIDYLFIEGDETILSGLREVAEAELVHHPGVAMKFLVTGKVPVNLTAKSAQEDNQLKYQMIAYGMILLLSMILFRGAIAVCVVAMAPVSGRFLDTGIHSLLRFSNEPLQRRCLADPRCAGWVYRRRAPDGADPSRTGDPVWDRLTPLRKVSAKSAWPVF